MSDDDPNDWRTMTFVGSSWDEQYSPSTCRWRHRRITLPYPGQQEHHFYHPWREGRAPDEEKST